MVVVSSHVEPAVSIAGVKGRRDATFGFHPIFTEEMNMNVRVPTILEGEPDGHGHGGASWRTTQRETSDDNVYPRGARAGMTEWLVGSTQL